MGWLRLVGSFKLYVSFAKDPYKRDYILQKRPIILGSLLIVATPYDSAHTTYSFERQRPVMTHITTITLPPWQATERPTHISYITLLISLFIFWREREKSEHFDIVAHPRGATPESFAYFDNINVTLSFIR